MAFLTGANNIGKEISDALGLKHVVNLDISIHLNSVVSVTALYYPEEDNVRALTPILKKYSLVPIEEE